MNDIFLNSCVPFSTQNVPHLEPLLSTIKTLDVLVYEAGHHTMSLGDLEEMQPTEIIDLMVSGIHDTMPLLARLDGWLMPYIARCDAQELAENSVEGAEPKKEEAEPREEGMYMIYI